MSDKKRKKPASVFAGLLGGMAGSAARDLQKGPTRNVTDKKSKRKKK